MLADDRFDRGDVLGLLGRDYPIGQLELRLADDFIESALLTFDDQKVTVFQNGIRKRGPLCPPSPMIAVTIASPPPGFCSQLTDCPMAPDKEVMRASVV